MKPFNFHTHNQEENYGIINLFPNMPICKNKIYSVGIHPWYYNENYKTELSIIAKNLTNKNIVAIGETGLDPKSPVNIDLQKQIFLQHVKLSENLEKPLIIHCVKYFDILIDLKKSYNPKQAWIIHGFNSNISIVKKLFINGFYISISETISKNQEKFNELTRIMPIDKVFYETDDKDSAIENIYNFTADKLGLKIEELSEQVKRNLKNIGYELA